MKKNILFVLAIGFLCSCQDKSTPIENAKVIHKSIEEAVDFRTAQRYFLKADLPTSNFKIKTESEFTSYFQPAAVMGKDGMPTPIDFSKEMVIALSLPETAVATEIEVKAITQNKEKNSLVVYYDLIVGDKMSYTIKPVTIVLVDLVHDAEVTYVQHEVKKD